MNGMDRIEVQLKQMDRATRLEPEPIL